MTPITMNGAPALRAAVAHLALVLVLIALPVAASAAVEGRACAAEPTDEVIQYGDLITCALDPKGDTDVFRFQGTTGEHVFVTATRPSGNVSPCIQLFRPSGGAPFASSNCTGSGFTFTASGTLDETGVWTINVFDGGTTQNVGPYNLVLDRLSPMSPSAEPLDYGATITGEINPLGDADLFALGATQGSTIAIQTARVGGTVRPCIYLYDPDAVLVASDCHTTGSSFAITTTLAKGGTHTLYVADRGNSETGTFSLTLQCISGVCPNLHTLTISAGPQGSPNPVRSAGAAVLDVTAADAFDHPRTYAWTASCPAALGSSGTFSDATAEDPTWTAPANQTGAEQVCTIHVVVSCDHGLTKEASYDQHIYPILPPDITVTPLALDFGSVAVGTSSTAQAVTIKNDGLTDDLVLKSITIAGTAFKKSADGCSNKTLGPGQSCTVSVQFTPGSTGAKSSTLSIPSNDPDPSENPTKVALTGTGASGTGLTPDITVAPMTLDFGSINVGSLSPAQTVTVGNVGTKNLVIKSVSSSSAQFQKTADGCSSQTIAPGQTCTVSVQFKPGSTGLKSATLSIPSNDPDESSVKVALTGTGTTGGGGGVTPDIAVSPSALDFGSIAVGSVSDPQPITVSNTGTGDLLVKNISLTGTAFQKSADGCSNTTVPPGQSCTVSVVFKPGATGAKSSTLSIPSNDPDASENPAKVALSGTAITGGGGGGGTVPDITVTPLALDFGSVAVGTASAPQPITIRNDGTGNLVIRGITVSGTAFQKTADGCSNTTLAPGQTCTVSAFFKPGATAAKSATLSIPSNDPDTSENPVRVKLTGLAT